MGHRLRGDRYAGTYFSDDWPAQQGLHPRGAAVVPSEFERSCRFGFG